jgi:rhodanese-related sulfurtransferase
MKEPEAISPDTVETYLGQPDIFIFDCNSTSSFKKHHVPGAKHLDPAGYKQSDLPPDKSATLIFYCSDTSCGAGPYAAKRAISFGFQNVLVMREGIKGWIKKHKIHDEPDWK